MTKTIYWKTSLRLWHDFEKTNDQQEKYEVREFYFEYRLNENLNFLIGKKINLWARSDEMSPLDFITPENYSYFLLWDRSQRVTGTYNIEASYYWENNNQVQLILFPYKQTSTFAPPSSNWHPTQYPLSWHDHTDYRQVELAAKYSKNLSQTDLDLIYFRGYHPFAQPALESSGFLATDEIHNTYALALAQAFENHNIRFELSYQDKGAWVNQKTLQKQVDKKIEINLGIDYLFPNDLYVNIQYVHHDFLQEDGPTDSYWLVQAQNSFFNDSLKASIKVGYSDKGNNGTLVNPQLEYQWAGQYQLRLGGFVFAGNNPYGLFSQYQNNDLAYLEFHYLF